jgi:hypothetical protein
MRYLLPLLVLALASCAPEPTPPAMGPDAGQQALTCDGGNDDACGAGCLRCPSGTACDGTSCTRAEVIRRCTLTCDLVQGDCADYCVFAHGDAGAQTDQCESDCSAHHSICLTQCG